MPNEARRVGKHNDKVPDADIQGDKAGQRNRDQTKAGTMPPPAGEVPDPSGDPRTQNRHATPARKD